MGTEGLHTIIHKEEIVEPHFARAYIDQPGMVDQTYLKHVRTYVSLGHHADEKNSVEKFERRVIREVKNAKAVRGYITGRYGQGKTSTALHLWQRARNENLLAVPPFKTQKLVDVIEATYGWVRYEIGRTRPDPTLTDTIEQTYDRLINRDADTLATEYGMTSADARRMIQSGRATLALTEVDYIQFFEQMTDVAQQADFDGLLVIADEVQQYIDPEIKAGIKDPVSALFDVIGAVLTRRNQLNFGLILIIPPRELGTLRRERGDLIHRMLDAPLDLRTIYNQQFPAHLWRTLAKEEKFTEHETRVIDPLCLASLGQIGARQDLADGPRTVVNTLRHATRRYIEHGHPHDDPYTPVMLIDDLLQDNITYDSSKRIAEATARALGHSFIKGHPERERAIKWAAAFPNEGVPITLREQLGLFEVYDELAQSLLGDLIVAVGGVDTAGITLKGLQEAQVDSDWVSMTTRQFMRYYYENHDLTRKRALASFMILLKQKVFPDNQWHVEKEIPSRLTRDMGLVLRGGFLRSAKKYPDRMVHVRVLWEDEPVKDPDSMEELLVEFRLWRHLDLTEGERRQKSEPLEIGFDARTIRVSVNLMHRTEPVAPRLQGKIGSIILPHKVTPLLLLNLHAEIEEARAKNQIDTTADQFVKNLFQPDLIDHAFREMFNEVVGSPVEAAQERLLERTLEQMLAAVYPDYRPIATVTNWKSSLNKYKNALQRLESNYERQGQIHVKGTKDEIANLFTYSNTALVNFARNFDSLLEGVNKLDKRSKPVRFTLHPLESAIIKWLQQSQQMKTVRQGGKAQQVHQIQQSTLYDRAKRLGYLDDEIDEFLALMEVRGLIEPPRRGLVCEAITQAPSVDELKSDIESWLRDVTTLLQADSKNAQLIEQKRLATEQRDQLTSGFRKKVDETGLIRAKRNVQHYRKQLDSIADTIHRHLHSQAEVAIGRLPPLQPQLKRTLSTSQRGNVDYVRSVNSRLRSPLEKQLVKLEADVNALRQGLVSTQSTLRSEIENYDTLVSLATAIRNDQPRLEQINDRVTQFDEDYAHYAQWVDLIEKGSRLSDEMQRLGVLVSAESTDFDNLSRDIKGALSADKLAALPHAPEYSVRLNDIIERVRQKANAATDTFNRAQEEYRSLLVQQLGFPRDQLWRPITYNPVAPDDSYRNVHGEVERGLRQFVNRSADAVGKLLGEVKATRNSPLINSLTQEQRDNLQGQGQESKTTLQTLRGELDSAESHITTDLISNADDPAFTELLNQLKTIRQHIQTIQPQVKQLSAELQKVKLTPNEQRLLQMIVGKGEVEAAELYDDTNDFWGTLGTLHAKRRILVRIEAVK